MRVQGFFLELLGQNLGVPKREEEAVGPDMSIELP